MENTIIINIMMGIVTLGTLYGIVWLVWNKCKEDVELDAILYGTIQQMDTPESGGIISTVGDKLNYSEFDAETQTFTMSRRDDM